MAYCFLDLGTTDSKQTNEQIIDGSKSYAKNQNSAVVKQLGSFFRWVVREGLPQGNCKLRSEKHTEADR